MVSCAIRMGRRTVEEASVRVSARVSRLASLVALLACAAACDDPCCTVDSRPIALERGPVGELLVRVATDGEPGLAPFDTGTPVTLWRAPDPAAAAWIKRRDLVLLGPAAAIQPAPVRAVLRGVLTVEAPLGALRSESPPLLPAAVIGGDLLSLFSVEIAFAAPAVTFWRHQPTADGFLAAAGYAVLKLPKRGGGQLDVLDPPDRLGQRSPHRFPASRLLVRACAAPAAFNREAPLPGRCCPNDERGLSSGADLSLLIATGIGPVVLARSAWLRVLARLPTEMEPQMTERPLHIASDTKPIPASWTTLPSLALVDREADLGADPGPCAELARARRLEQVAFRQSLSSEVAACVLPCDADPADREKTPPESIRAQNSAAYLEVGSDIEVAIVDDTTSLLHAVRTEVRPSGPEVDGLLGAAALAQARVELDYVAKQPRGIFSCEPGASAGPLPRRQPLPETSRKRAAPGLLRPARARTAQHVRKYQRVRGLIRLVGPLLAASLCGPSGAAAQSSAGPSTRPRNHTCRPGSPGPTPPGRKRAPGDRPARRDVRILARP